MMIDFTRSKMCLLQVNIFRTTEVPIFEGSVGKTIFASDDVNYRSPKKN